MRKLFITLMAVVVVLTFAGFAVAQEAAEWFDPGWAYRLPVVVESPCGSEVINYQVQVILDSSLISTSHSAMGATCESPPVMELLRSLSGLKTGTVGARAFG